MSPPSSTIRPSQCGGTLAAYNSFIYATDVPLATRYRFEITNGAFVYVLESPLRYFQPKEVVGGLSLNTTYSIKVASLYNGLWSSYGTACNVTIPSNISRMAKQSASIKNVFEVKAFPNPFATHFSLDIQSSSDEVLEMKVYDMIGRQLEIKKASVSELSTQEIGINYPSGIYTIIVKQGENVQSLRMIKR